MKQVIRQIHKDGTREACLFLTLPDLVYGIILKEFTCGKIQLPEVYRKVGAKISIDKKIMRTCLVLLSEQGLIKFHPMGRTGYIVRCC